MFSPRRFAGGYSLSLATSLLLLTSLAHGEPPLMKEQSVEPKIQAISPDGRFAISLGGFLQARYRGASIEKEADVSQFGNPRARLYSFGYIHSKDFRYRLMMGTLPHSQQIQLFDAYVEVRMADELRLRAGRFKMPVFREWVESARLQSSTERSALTMLLSPGRDYGLMASGSFLHENIEYALGVFNGAGEVAAVDSNATPAFAGRMVWNTTGRSIEGEVDFHHSPLAVAIGASGSSAWKPSTPAVTEVPYG
jgi:phosphate-selective porin